MRNFEKTVYLKRIILINKKKSFWLENSGIICVIKMKNMVENFKNTEFEMQTRYKYALFFC